MSEYNRDRNRSSPSDQLALATLDFSELSPETRQANLIKANKLLPGQRCRFPGVSARSGLSCDGILVEDLSRRFSDYLFTSGTYVGLTKDGYLLFRGMPLYEATIDALQKTRYKERHRLKGKREFYFGVKTGPFGTEIVPEDENGLAQAESPESTTEYIN